MVVPILLASNKTKLTNLGGNKMAWPVYMLLGNLSMTLWSSPSTTVVFAPELRYELRIAIGHYSLR